MDQAEEKARRLLMWATLLATVSLGILLIDLTIKKQIVEAAHGGDQEKHGGRTGLRVAVPDLAGLVPDAPGPQEAVGDEGSGPAEDPKPKGGRRTRPVRDDAGAAG